MTTNSIPAKAIVEINPNVLNANGAQLQMNAVFLTNNDEIPAQQLYAFSNATDVGAFFGSGTAEETAATIYFNGYEIGTSTPGRLYFYYKQIEGEEAAIAGWMRGSSLQGMTVAELNDLPTGTITITIDDVTETTGTIDLTSAASFSAAAALIQTALQAAFGPNPTCSYNSQQNAFQITSSTTGASSSVTVATSNSLTAGLKLTAATGAITSPGQAVLTPAQVMNQIVAISQNWATFMEVNTPTLSSALPIWNNSQNNLYLFVGYHKGPDALTTSNTALMLELIAADISGTTLIYGDVTHAAFTCGVAASINFNQLNGRPTFAFKNQSGLVASIANETYAANLIANGYNFYGSYATRADEFTFLYPGAVTGDYAWIDSYINQIWLNSGMQTTLMSLLTQIPSIPYNQRGYTMIATSLLGNIQEAINYGAIRVGVRPSAVQAVIVNNAAGLDITNELFSQGYYLQVLDPGATVRQERGTPVINLWYMDGQAVQRIVMTSTLLK